VFVFAHVEMFSFEPTSDALFTEHVYQPLAQASGSAVGLSAVATAIALLARRWRNSSVAVFGLSVLCTLCVLAVAALTLGGARAMDHRMHPEGRMLAALRLVPVAPDWQALSPPAMRPKEDLPGTGLVAPEARAEFAPAHQDRNAACATLEALLVPAGWNRLASSCWFSHETGDVRVSATVPDDTSLPVTVRFEAYPVSR
jgi:hypothetical protein